jgi:hypothetical protein
MSTFSGSDIGCCYMNGMRKALGIFQDMSLDSRNQHCSIISGIDSCIAIFLTKGINKTSAGFLLAPIYVTAITNYFSK